MNRFKAGLRNPKQRLSKGRESRASRFRTLVRIWGPAWLVMIADVDAASVITAAENGVLYGTKLIWLLIVLTVPLFVIQEVAGRVGAVTGKGLGQLIRENFAPRVAAIAALPMIGADVTIYVLEYAGIAIGLQIFGIPAYVSVPSTFVLNILLVYRRRLAQIEKPLLAISFVLAVSYGVSAYLVASSGIRFTPFYFAASPTFLFLLAANLGSTIVPFMLFYQSSASAEKGITSKNLWAMRLETAVRSDHIGVDTDCSGDSCGRGGRRFRGSRASSGLIQGVVDRVRRPGAILVRGRPRLCRLRGSRCRLAGERLGGDERHGMGKESNFQGLLARVNTRAGHQPSASQSREPRSGSAGAPGRLADCPRGLTGSDSFKERPDGILFAQGSEQASLLVAPACGHCHWDR